MSNGRKRIRLAIVGCGLVVESAHLPAALRSPSIEVSALVDPLLARIEHLAALYSFRPRTAASLEEVLPEVDAVLLATPNHTHFPLAKLAIISGKGVLVEKPLTNTYAEAIELCDLAEQKDVVISVGFVTRYRESVLLMKDLLDSGALGQVYDFNYQFGTAGGWAPASGYNLLREQSSGGVLVVSGTHFLDRMLYFFGWPKQFAYEDDSRGGIEANCRATVCYSDPLRQISGTIALSKTTTLANRLIINTDRYECHLPEDSDQPLKLHPRNMPHLIHSVSYRQQRSTDPFQLQLESFAHAVLTHGRTKVDGRDGALCVKLVEELYAHRTQMPEPWSSSAKGAQSEF